MSMLCMPRDRFVKKDAALTATASVVFDANTELKSSTFGDFIINSFLNFKPINIFFLIIQLQHQPQQQRTDDCTSIKH